MGSAAEEANTRDPQGNPQDPQANTPFAGRQLGCVVSPRPVMLRWWDDCVFFPFFRFFEPLRPDFCASKPPFGNFFGRRCPANHRVARHPETDEPAAGP